MTPRKMNSSAAPTSAMLKKKLKMLNAGCSWPSSGIPNISLVYRLYPMSTSGYIPTSSPLKKPLPRRRSRYILPVRPRMPNATTMPTASCTALRK